MQKENKLNRRHKRICEMVREKGYISIKELAAEFKLTPQTIRRDIRELSGKNEIENIHGGVRLVKNNEDVTDSVTLSSPEASVSYDYGVKVASLIPNGVSVLLAAGAKSVDIAKSLSRRKKLHE